LKVIHPNEKIKRKGEKMDTESVNIHTESTWKTPDGVTLFWQEWKPQTAPKACVVIVHGIGEHSGRYQHVAEYFNKSGYAVLGFDHRGHGRSEGARGYFGYDQATGDIVHFVDDMAAQYSGKPVILYGHSLGGALVLYYGFTQKMHVKAVVCTSPGLDTAQPLPAAKLFLARLMSKVYPAMQMKNDLDISGVSRDPEVPKRYMADQLNHPYVTALLGMDLITKGQWMQKQTSFPVPLLLLQGGADRIVNAKATQTLAKNLGDHVEFHLLDGHYHELQNEPDQLETLNLIRQWMDRQVQ
jgi:acylglycerol lipase